jgi:hypothetical protein
VHNFYSLLLVNFYGRPMLLPLYRKDDVEVFAPPPLSFVPPRVPPGQSLFMMGVTECDMSLSAPRSRREMVFCSRV